MSRPPTPVEGLGVFLVGLVVGRLLARLAARLDGRTAVVVPDGIDWDEESQTWHAYSDPKESR